MKMVLCHGCWDLLHIGHVQHLKDARKFGTYLVVSVVADKYIADSKRPTAYDQRARVSVLKELRCVDQVVLCNAPGPESIIKRIYPDVYVRGEDYKGRRMPEQDLLEQLGIPVRYTKLVMADWSKKVSSSDISARAHD